MHRLTGRHPRAALAVLIGLGSLVTAVAASVPAPAAAVSPLSWSTVTNNAVPVPGSAKLFNSYSQPSVSANGVVVFGARTKGPSSPVRGIYMRNAVGGGPVTTVAQSGGTVPQPNNTAATFNDFPAFPRLDASGLTVAVRGQSTPVWTYTVDGTDTKTGTSGIYATVGGALTSVATTLGAVPGMEQDAVPGAPPGTKFDQFPGAAAVTESDIVFKGNYTDGGVSKTGDYYRSLTQPGPIMLIANSATRIPNQPEDGQVTFGSTAPPSASGHRAVFVGWDNENAPSLGGLYLADLNELTPTIQTIVGLGDAVPGQPDQHFTNIGEGVSFDGRYVAFFASWGSETQSVPLTCPADGNAQLIAYCLQEYPNGYIATVPAHQGVFVADTLTGDVVPVATTGSQFSDLLYWVFSGRPPGTGGGDEETLEPPRWRSAAFVAVSGLPGDGFQVAFKASTTNGVTGIYLEQTSSGTTSLIDAVDTTTPGTVLDPSAPAGSFVTALGLERDGFRGRYLAITATMLDPATQESWAGIYLSQVPEVLAGVPQVITVSSTPPQPGQVGDTYQPAATSDSGLAVAISIDPATT
ncbi:MAG: hypothetical protein M0004_12090, partial [Actinomycetota bacterium]|nr:hypothetical protein [Actinomycetota bacterium]